MNYLYYFINGFNMIKLWIEENKIEKPDYPDNVEFYEFQEIIKITDEIKKKGNVKYFVG